MLYQDLAVFTGNAHPQLATDICASLEMPVGQCEVFEFSNENIFVRILENVRSKDVFLVQPLSSPVNRSVMELLIMIDAFRRASAGRITAVIPYYAYGRSDKKDQPRVPITAKLVADGVAELSGAAETSLIVKGQGWLLDETAAGDLERVRMLFDDLERKEEVIDVLSAAKDGEGVRIFIGAENRLFSLSGSSVIVGPYRDRTRKIVGVLGVIGPTRLNYARVIPIVDYTAEAVSRLLK